MHKPLLTKTSHGNERYFHMCIIIITDFISELGRRLTSVSGDLREGAYLFQRLSLSIQRYNAIAFTGSFLRPPDDTY